MIGFEHLGWKRKQPLAKEWKHSESREIAWTCLTYTEKWIRKNTVNIEKIVRQWI